MPALNRQPPHAPQHSHAGSTALGRLLDLDARVHASLLDDALDAVAGHLGHDPVRRVLDVGAGTGAATFRWSARYPEAEVVALDANPAMTQQIAVRVGHERIRTITRPVTAMGLEAGCVDLAWASSVFHEFDDPAAAFAALAQVIRPGGVLAVMEMDGPPRVLPGDYDELEARLRTLTHADASGPQWTALLGAAGFELLEKKTLVSDQNLPADGVGGDYARAELHRLALHAADGLTAEQEASLARILQPDPETPALPSVHIRGARSLWIARRP